MGVVLPGEGDLAILDSQYQSCRLGQSSPLSSQGPRLVPALARLVALTSWEFRVLDGKETGALPQTPGFCEAWLGCPKARWP